MTSPSKPSTAAATSTGAAQAVPEVGMPTHPRPGHTIVALHGDLDIAAAPALREHLLAAVHHSARQMTLDLGEVRFCDAAGLAVLIGTHRRATLLGITLHLASPNPQVAKLLHITGLGRILAIQPPARPDSRIST